MEKTIDPYSKREFVKTRSNQVYENRENQIKHNNEKAKERRDSLASITKVLNANLKIIQNLLGSENKVIKSHEFMIGAGFNFGCITHSLILDGSTYYCIFNVGFRKVNTDKIELKNLQND